MTQNSLIPQLQSKQDGPFLEEYANFLHQNAKTFTASGESDAQDLHSIILSLLETAMSKLDFSNLLESASQELPDPQSAKIKSLPHPFRFLDLSLLCKAPELTSRALCMMIHRDKLSEQQLRLGVVNVVRPVLSFLRRRIKLLNPSPELRLGELEALVLKYVSLDEVCDAPFQPEAFAEVLDCASSAEDPALAIFE